MPVKPFVLLPVALLAGAGALISPSSLEAQTGADSAAVVEASLDYIEGWFAGDGDRMRRGLHPELVKRIIGPNGAIRQQSTEDLAGMADGKGPDAEQPDMHRDVHILDMTARSAMVRIDAPGWIDFMQLARFSDGWKIVNVLWELR